MATDVDECAGIPPRIIRGNFERDPPVWRDLIKSDPCDPYARKTRLCAQVYDTQSLQRKANQTCNFGNTCKFAHRIEHLRPPDSTYNLNARLTSDTPQELTAFNCSDWGSGRADDPAFRVPFEAAYPTKVTRLVQRIADGD